MKRRGLLAGLGALFVAPAIVRATSLMPVSVLEPTLLAPEAVVAESNAAITLGRTRWIFEDDIWKPAPPEAPDWSEATPLLVEFDGYMHMTNGGNIDTNAQEAFQRVLDNLANATQQARVERWRRQQAELDEVAARGV